MQSSSSPYRQQFIPLLPDSYSRLRQHSAPSPTSAASIWAPQPQSPGGTWPKSLHSYANHHPVLGERRGLGFRQPLFPISDERPLTREDVFGPLGGTEQASRIPIGPIGEGRRKDNPLQDSNVSSSNFDFCVDTVWHICAYIHPTRTSTELLGMQHIEQLFRSLDLTSPPPTDGPNYSTSQVDYDSPSTSSSYPTTPLESSPIGSRTADVLFNALCDFPSHAPSALHSASTPLSSSLPHSKGSSESSWNDNFLSPVQADVLPGHTQSFSQTAFNSYSPFDSPVEETTGSPFSASPVEHVHMANAYQKPSDGVPGWPKLQIPYEPVHAYNRSYEQDLVRSPFEDRNPDQTFNGATLAPQHQRQHQQAASNEVSIRLMQYGSFDLIPSFSQLIFSPCYTPLLRLRIRFSFLASSSLQISRLQSSCSRN